MVDVVKNRWDKVTGKGQEPQAQPKPEKQGLVSRQDANREDEAQPKTQSYSGPGRTLIIESGDPHLLNLEKGGPTAKEYAAANAAGYKVILHIDANHNETRFNVQDGHAKAQGKSAAGRDLLKNDIKNAPMPTNHAQNGNNIFATRIQVNLGQQKEVGPGEPGRTLRISGLTNDPMLHGKDYDKAAKLGIDRIGREGALKDVAAEAAAYQVHEKRGTKPINDTPLQKIERAEEVASRTVEIRAEIQSMKVPAPDKGAENAHKVLEGVPVHDNEMPNVRVGDKAVFTAKECEAAKAETKSLDKGGLDRTK
jgi:hypothetical protein